MNIPTVFRVHAPVYRNTLKDACEIHNAAAGLATLEPEILERISVLVTSGYVGANQADIDLLPSLKLISTIGSGYENVDIEAASRRNIMITHAAGSNSPAVAEHAVGLLLALVRDIPGYDREVKLGRWRGDIQPRPMLAGKKIGIAGIGDIGCRVAKRAEALDLEVHYFSRTPKDLPGWKHVPDLGHLASQVDFLISTLPGGSATHHAINADVLSALGANGYLVNIGRGSVVDTQALVLALSAGAIAGAALDVFETEPQPSIELRALPNVILTPHIGGVTHEAQQISANLMLRNIQSFFDGTGIISPIPELRPG